MRYTAPDGFIIQSDSTQPVTYSCPCTNIGPGIYDALETEGAGTEIGIRQIKIHKIVDNGIITITVTESTDDELRQYIESTKTNN